MTKIDWSNFSVLIVEDDPALSEILEAYFQTYGAKVNKASHGEEALQILGTSAIDLVLSDIQMPVMDGVTLLKTVRGKDPKIPIVFIISGQSDYSEEQLLKLGASGYMAKPFSLKEFSSRINGALGLE